MQQHVVALYLALVQFCCAGAQRPAYTRPSVIPFCVVQSDGSPPLTELADAVEFWQRESGRPDLIVWEPPAGGRCSPIHVYYDLPFQASPERVTLGIAHPAIFERVQYACTIQILPISNDSALEQKVLRHEIGHCLGLLHEDSGLMHRFINRATEHVTPRQKRFLKNLRAAHN